MFAALQTERQRASNAHGGCYSARTQHGHERRDGNAMGQQNTKQRIRYLHKLKGEYNDLHEKFAFSRRMSCAVRTNCGG